MDKPTPTELQKFIEIFERLDQFQAEQRVIRGYGAVAESECPVPEVVKTMAWLREQAAEYGSFQPTGRE